MAVGDLDTNLGFVDKRRTGSAAVLATPTATDANYADVTAMRTRLAAAQPATYTAAVLNLMTKNDMVYALRVIDDLAGI